MWQSRTGHRIHSLPQTTGPRLDGFVPLGPLAPGTSA